MLVHQRPQQPQDLDHAEWVDRGRGFVEDQQVRGLDQRIRDAQALAHAPRVRVDPVVGPIVETDPLEDVVDRRFPASALRRPLRCAV